MIAVLGKKPRTDIRTQLFDAYLLRFILIIIMLALLEDLQGIQNRASTNFLEALWQNLTGREKNLDVCADSSRL